MLKCFSVLWSWDALLVLDSVNKGEYMAKISFDGVVGLGVLRLTACAALALCFLVSCDDASSSASDEFKDESDIQDRLPTCDKSLEGETRVQGEYTYVCSGSFWMVAVDSTAMPDTGDVDTTKHGDSVVVKDTTQKQDSVSTDTTVVDTVKHSDTPKKDSVQEQKPIEKKNVALTGVAEYGKFGAKATVLVEELDASLKKTGVSYTASISSKNGSFSVANAAMAGPYALVTVAGVPSNMAKASVNSSGDTLSVIVRVDESVSVNVNALSFFVSERTMALLKAKPSMTFDEAFKKAAAEVWTAFGFEKLKSEDPGKVTMANGKESGSALLATSVLLHSLVGDSASGISKIAAALAGGEAVDSLSLAKMADWAFNEDMSDEFDEVTENVKKAGVTQVPEFGKVLRDFYLAKLGLGDCDESKAGSIAFATNRFSAYFAKDYSDVSVTSERFKCEDGAWTVALDKEKNTYGFEAGTDGELRQGLINADQIYSYSGSWRLVTSRTERDAYFVQKSNITDFVDLKEVYESIKDDERVIFVLRHGERDKDATDRKSSLSENGYKECVKVGGKLTKFKEPFRLGASEFYRAQQTVIGMAAGRGQDTVVADTFAFLNDDWYMIDRDKVNQVEGEAGGGWEAIGYYVYEGKYPEAYYDLNDRSAQLIDTLLATYADVPDRFILLSSHDKLMVPFVAYCSNLNLNMHVRNGGTWINYLAGIAIIWDKSGNRRYVAFKGLENAYFRGW